MGEGGGSSLGRVKTEPGGGLSLIPRGAQECLPQSLSRREAMGPFCHIPTSGVFSCEPPPEGGMAAAPRGRPGRGGPSARVVLSGRGQLCTAGSQDPSSRPWVKCTQTLCLVSTYSVQTESIKQPLSLANRWDSASAPRQRQ